MSENNYAQESAETIGEWLSDHQEGLRLIKYVSLITVRNEDGGEDLAMNKNVEARQMVSLMLLALSHTLDPKQQNSTVQLAASALLQEFDKQMLISAHKPEGDDQGDA